jgi:hypothetical protein
MKQFVAGVIITLVVGYFINSELRTEVMGWTVRLARNIYKMTENTKTDFGKQLSEKVQQFTIYQSNWQIERIKIAETQKGYEYQISAKHPVSGLSVFYKTSDLKLIPDRNLYYTITLGGDDATEIETSKKPAQTPAVPDEELPSKTVQDAVSY